MTSSISDIQDSGKLIVLDDGSKWAISTFDAFTTKMWMRFDKIEIGSGKLTNASRRNESVSARRA